MTPGMVRPEMGKTARKRDAVVPLTTPSRVQKGFSMMETYEEGVHELDLDALAGRVEPHLIDHARAVIVQHSRAEEIQQDRRQKRDSVPPAENCPKREHTGES